MAHKNFIYLDYAAATPIDERVFKAMRPYFTESFYNPSATYGSARQVAADLLTARKKVAEQLGSRPSEVVFTAGGSEANNLAIHGVMRQFPGANIVVTATEHDSVLLAAGHYDRRVVPVQPDGRIDLAALDKAIDENTVLVSVMYANNEIGTVQPIKDIAEIISKKRAQRAPNHLQSTPHHLPLLFHTDASQAANYLDLHVSRLGVDLMSLNGGKVYGPKQSGVLYVKAGVRLRPLVDGGGQEQGLRSGTENVAAAVGFAEALALAQSTRHDESQRLKPLQRRLIEQILAKVPSASLNGSAKHRLPNNAHFSFNGVDNERLLIQLEQAGILAAAGSACSASSAEPSHVLSAIGLSDNQSRSSIRFSLGRSTTERDIDATVAVLMRLLAA